MPPSILLAVVQGLCVANLFYSQSLLPLIATDMNLTAGQVVLGPMATQAGLALSLLFILPIGDGVNRRTMLIFVSLGTAAAAGALALLTGFHWLLVAWFCLGLFTLVPYLLPAYLSGLVPEIVRGRLLGTVLSGHFGGILLSRSLSGVIGESFGWRTVFIFSSLVMLAVALLFRLLLPREQPAEFSRIGGCNAPSRGCCAAIRNCDELVSPRAFSSAPLWLYGVRWRFIFLGLPGSSVQPRSVASDWLD